MGRWLWLVALLLSGCGGGRTVDSGGQPSVCGESSAAVADLDSDHQRQQQVALAARDELFRSLSGRLMEVVSRSGPASAISVCKTDAPRMAGEVGERYGVAIGRTSHRLRNPDNAPREWVRPLVERQVTEPTFVPLPNGALGALLPIRLKSNCLLCHGPPEQIVPEVQAALAEDYPQDQATGFAEDDLRGWFWIEVPAGVGLPPAPDTAATSGSWRPAPVSG